MKAAKAAVGLVLLSLAAGAAAGAGSGRRVEVIVSKNTELFGVLANLTPEWDRAPDHSRTAVETRRRFLAFREHRTVGIVQSLLQRRNAGSLMKLALRLSNFPEARPLLPMGPLFLRPVLDRSVSAVRDFYVDSGFEEFWRERLPVLERWAADCGNSLAAVPIVETIEGFFGTQNDTYALVFAAQADGLRTRDLVPTGRGEQLTAIFGPGEVVPDGSSAVDVRAIVIEVILREFTQIMATGIVEEHRQTAGKYANLQERIRKRRGLSGPGSPWRDFWIDNLTAAVQARLARTLFGEAAAADVLERIHPKDLLAPDVYVICAEYENARNRFPTFRSFFPVLMARLETRLTPPEEKGRR